VARFHNLSTVTGHQSVDAGLLEKLQMRVVIAVIAIAFLMVPAHAQTGMGKGQRHQGTQKKQDTTTKVDEKAYKNALKGIPTPNEKPDPWKSMR
jgi:hypothetical protein